MFDPGTLNLSIILIIIGLTFTLGAFLLLWILPKSDSDHQASTPHVIPLDISKNKDGIIVIESGGRVTYINNRARQLFSVGEEDPNLEHLVKRSRPENALLGLCAQPGTARFSLNNRSVEGISHSIPLNGRTGIVLSLRFDQSTSPVSSDAVHAHQILGFFSQLNQSISKNFTLENALKSVLGCIESLAPADMRIISLWDDEKKTFTSYQYEDLVGKDRELIASKNYEVPEHEYRKQLIREKKPLLIQDILSHSERTTITPRKYAYRSYLGMPLLLADKFIGVLEMISLSRNNFTEMDINILEKLSGHIAITLHNALLYQDEQKQVLELSSLATLSRAINSTHDTSDFYAKLIQAITPLLDVEIAGFLIYNKTQRRIFAQWPFHGLPANFIPFYHIDIPPDSSAEEIWLSAEPIVTNTPHEDPRIKDLGFDHAACAAGIHTTALIPLTSSGRKLGYLQAANKYDRTAFNHEDIRLLEIIAGQAAPIIENAELVQQSAKRALRSEGLRRITSLTTSDANLDEIFKYCIQELARLLHADKAAFYIFDTDQGNLILHSNSLFGIQDDLSTRIKRLEIKNSQRQLLVSQSQNAFLTGNVLENLQQLNIYRPFLESFGGNSAIIVPVIVNNLGFGEIFLVSNQSYSYTQNDLLLAETIAGQIAIAIERSQLAKQTDEKLRRRVDQLTALTQLSKELNLTQNLKQLLQQILAAALRTTRADCGTILLFELNDNNNGFPKIMMHVGDLPGEELSSLERAVFNDGKPKLIRDFHDYAENHEESLSPPHKNIRSGVIAPIAYQDHVTGLLYLHAKKSGHFDNTAVEITQALGIQAAIALGNAQQYQQQVEENISLSSRVETLNEIFKSSRALNLDKPLEESLEDISYSIQATTPFEVVLISVYNQEDKQLHRISGVGIPSEIFDELRSHPQSWSQIEAILKPEFRYGRSHFIPSDKVHSLPPNIHRVTLLSRSFDQEYGDVWQPEDVLIIPLMDRTGNPLGLISVDAPSNGLRPDILTIETLEIFASQSVLIIEAHQKIRALETELLEDVKDQGQLQEIGGETKEQLITLAESQLVGSATKKSLDNYSKRMIATLEIVSQVHQQRNRLSVLKTLGSELLAKMGMDVVLIVEPQPEGNKLLFNLGDTPDKSQLKVLLGQRNPIAQCIRIGEHILVEDLDENEQWRDSSLLKALSARGFISLLISSNTELDSVILASSYTPLSNITQEEILLFDLIARQSSQALHNIQLIDSAGDKLKETNLLLDISHLLTELDTDVILNTMIANIQELVSSSQSVMVALWDDETNLLVPKAAQGYKNIESIFQIAYAEGEALAGKVFEQGLPIHINELDFNQTYDMKFHNLLFYKEATDGEFPASSLCVPIRSNEKTLGVLQLENYQNPNAFSFDDQKVIISIAQLTAMMLEYDRVYKASEHWAKQLQVLTELTRSISSSLHPNSLINSLFEQLEKLVPFSTGTLWLREGNQLVIKATRGFDPSESLIGISTRQEDSALFDEMIHTGYPLLVGDMGSDNRFPELDQRVYNTWLGVPIKSKGEVLGVIALEHEKFDVYTKKELEIAKIFAGQVAIALENARLFQRNKERTNELSQRTERIDQLYRFSKQISSSLYPKEILEDTIKELLDNTRASRVSAIVLDDHEDNISSKKPPILFAEVPLVDVDLPDTLPATPLFEQLKQSFGIFVTDDVYKEKNIAQLREFFEARGTIALLSLPLIIGEKVAGFFLLHCDQDDNFTASDIDISRIITNQASAAMQNAKLFEQTNHLKESLEDRIKERTEQLGREHQKAKALLRIMNELSSSLDLDQMLTRTMTLLNETVGAEQCSIMLIHPDENSFYYRASRGMNTENGSRYDNLNIKPFDKAIASWVIKQREGQLISNVFADERFSGEVLATSQHPSLIVVPLQMGEEILGALLLSHQQKGQFNENHLELVQGAANQIAVAINNAELFNLIRDQAEDLGSMLRNQQVEASRSRAILEAVADGVLVTNAAGEITLFNHSAQQILDLDGYQLIGKSLDQFIGLFGKAAKAWIDTIRRWSKDPKSLQTGDTYEEQITLDQGQVVAVHLAPVSLDEEFFGTVSIFRDITHLIELDRLKSEFVARVSHELRTPMTSIQGYVDLLLMGAAGELNQQQDNFLEIVKNNTERLHILVNDLLDVSRIETDQIKLSIQALNLHELTDEVTMSLRKRSQEDGKRLDVTKDIPSNIPRIYGDRDCVQKILNNLLSNAYNYTPSGGSIVIRARTKGKHIQIDIQDNGIGIPPAEQEQIFERFYRGEDPLVLATSGTGLGLSIVQQLVDKHNGEIWLESRGLPGEGSTFSFTLPTDKLLVQKKP